MEFVATPASGLKWEKIDNELYREYVFPGGAVVRIDSPIELSVKRDPEYRGVGSGDSHRVKSSHYDLLTDTVHNMAHYVPKGWIELRWTGKDGSHAFNF